MLSKRNHYETFFDFTILNIINSKQQKISSDVIISLNFIAGNPVNFQLILNQAAVENTPPIKLEDNSKLLPFIQLLNSYDNQLELKDLLVPLLDLSGAEILAIYDISTGNIEPHAGVAAPDSFEFTFDSIPPLSNLHYQIKETQIDFSLVNKDNVQMAIEKFNEAPNEFITLREVSGVICLIRYIYREEADVVKVSKFIEDSKLALDLISKISKEKIIVNETVDAGPDIKFTIGFLDSLNIGALLTNETGEIAGYNPNFISLIGDNEIQGNIKTVLDLLKEYNPDHLIEQIEEYLTTPLNEEHPDDLLVDIHCPSDELRRLTVIKFSVDPSDRSGCFVFLPVSSPSIIEPDIQSDNKSLREFSKSISNLLSSVATLSGNITKNCNDHLDKSETGRITNLRSNIISINEVVSRFNKIIKLKQSTKDLCLTDLSILANRAIDAIGLEYQGIKLQSQIKTLPKIKTSPGIINEVLESIIANSFEYCYDNKVTIEISAKQTGGFCSIIIKDNSQGIPKRIRDQIFDQSQLSQLSNSTHVISLYNNLAICKQLMQELGGDLQLVSSSKNETLFEIKIPTE